MPEPSNPALADRLDSLERSLDEHRQELRTVRDAIDELREVLDWIARNPEPRHPFQLGHSPLVSMPLDPTANDFAARVNEISPGDLPDETDFDPVVQPRDEEGIAPAECEWDAPDRS